MLAGAARYPGVDPLGPCLVPADCSTIHDLNCLKAPFSPPALSTTVARQDGFKSAGGNCGTKRRWKCIPLIWTPCGRPVAGDSIGCN